MTIVGCDFHPSWQQIAALDVETGEITECRLMNGNGEAERFYQALPAPSLIGIEACGNSQWLIELWQRLGHEVWIGDAAQIRASYVRKQKTRQLYLTSISVPQEIESSLASRSSFWRRHAGHSFGHIGRATHLWKATVAKIRGICTSSSHTKTPSRRTPKKSDDRVALTLKVSQRDYERFCLLGARTHQTAMEILEEALKRTLREAGI